MFLAFMLVFLKLYSQIVSFVRLWLGARISPSKMRFFDVSKTFVLSLFLFGCVVVILATN